MELRNKLRSVGKLRQQSKERCISVKNRRLLDSLPVIELQLGTIPRSTRLRTEHVVSQRNTRHGRDTEYRVVFDRAAQCGVNAIAQTAMHFPDVAIVHPVGQAFWPERKRVSSF